MFGAAAEHSRLRGGNSGGQQRQKTGETEEEHVVNPVRCVMLRSATAETDLRVEMVMRLNKKLPGRVESS